MSSGSLNRREFFNRAGAAGIGAALASTTAFARAQDQDAAAPRATSAGEIPRRPFGKTGEQVSIIGVGGHAIGLCKVESEAIRLMHEAIDNGLNFFDNAWEYHDGRSEQWMGNALKGRRDKVFLMTKVCTHGRDAKVGMQQLEESLKRLQTDHLDLWQIHECVYYNDPERHFAKGGVVEALDQAKKQGKVRFVGFTGHKDPVIHLEMLKRDFAWDACQFPINPFDAHFRSFQKQVLPELNQRGIAPIGMKSLGGTGEMIKKGVLTIEEALGYALSQPIATLVSGMDSLEVLRQNVKIARAFKPLSEAEQAAIVKKVEDNAGDGRFELYKVSMRFEGPPGREMHGFKPQPELPG
jgi:uncharacterized protein